MKSGESEQMSCQVWLQLEQSAQPKLMYFPKISAYKYIIFNYFYSWVRL